MYSGQQTQNMKDNSITQSEETKMKEIFKEISPGSFESIGFITDNILNNNTCETEEEAIIEELYHELRTDNSFHFTLTDLDKIARIIFQKRNSILKILQQ